MVFLHLTGKYKFRIGKPKVVIAILLIGISVLRIYIATGNPVYPAWPVDLADWGISSDIQQKLINGTDAQTGPGLRQYVGVQRSLLGYVIFALSFVFVPHRVKSSYWFSPFLISSFIVGIYYFVKDKYYHSLSVNAWYLVAMLQVLLFVWLFYSPLFRFAAGVFIFITLKLYVFCQTHTRSWRPRLFLSSAVGLTLGFFTLNVARHVNHNIIAVLRHTPEAVTEWMPWEGADRDKFTTNYTADGFRYSRADAMYCQRMLPPCISMRSLADAATLIHEYRKYNRY
jgi:hypothetical protein